MALEHLTSTTVRPQGPIGIRWIAVLAIARCHIRPQRPTVSPNATREGARLTGAPRSVRPRTVGVKPHRATRVAVLTAVAVAAFPVIADAASGLPPFTTAPKASGSSGRQAEVFGVSAACHPTFDRLVIRARFGTPGYDVRYVRRIREDGSGRRVRLRGTKRIRVVVRNARGHTQSGANLLPPVLDPLCSNLRQTKDAGDFEGQVTLGLGLRRKTGFRVFRLTAPTRIVIDIAH